MNGPGPERRRSRQYYILILLLISLPLLGGAKCAFWFSSGDSDRDDKPPPEEPEETAQQGSVGDTAIAGLWYESGSLSGVTGPTGLAVHRTIYLVERFEYLFKAFVIYANASIFNLQSEVPRKVSYRRHVK